jgi:hypothetical protein
MQIRWEWPAIQPGAHAKLSPVEQSFQSMTRLGRLLAILLLLAAPVAAQKNDWLIVPGQRVGPITAATTRADLDTLFGKENVHDGTFEGGDVPEAATVVWGGDASTALAITWDRERPSTIHVCVGTQTGPCRWRTASGIRVGLPLRELEKLNGKAFQVAGIGQEQGKVASWKRGALEEDPAICGHLLVRLTPMAEIEGRTMSKDEANSMKSLQGDKPANSNSVVLLDLNLIVSRMALEFSGSACGK